MTARGKAAPLATGTASDAANEKLNSTARDRLIGWFNLAKPAKDRQQKRSWKRGNQRGRIDACLVGQLALLIVAALLIVGGVKV